MSDAYVTPQQLIAAFGEREIIELTDRAEPRDDSVDYAVAKLACDRAGAEIEASLAVGRYVLPLASVPALLRFTANDLARYYLYEHSPPQLVIDRFNGARATLLALATGRQSLGLDAAGAAAAPPPENMPVFVGGRADFAGRDW
jgi:phage gp36-like protein